MIEEALNEVFLADDVGQKLLRSLDQPEGEDFVQVAAQGWVQVTDLLLLLVWVWLLVERDKFIHEGVRVAIATYVVYVWLIVQ